METQGDSVMWLEDTRACFLRGLLAPSPPALFTPQYSVTRQHMVFIYYFQKSNYLYTSLSYISLNLKYNIVIP